MSTEAVKVAVVRIATLERPHVRAVLLALIFVLALLPRTILTYDQVFRSDRVAFATGDAAFHMRTVENLMHHFPRRSGFDPYSAMPTGQAVTTGPFFDLAIGTIAWIAGLGSPSDWLTDAIGAWFPVVLGAMVVIPVYFLGKNLFHPAAGLLAALFAAILPGDTLGNSLIGNPDHHVAETLFSTMLLLFLVLAATSNRRLLHTLLAGISLGLFLETRPAGIFLAACITGWALIQSVRDHWTGRRGSTAPLTVAAAFSVGLLMFLPVGALVWSQYTFFGLGTGILASVLAAVLCISFERWRTPQWLYPAAGAAVLIIVIGSVMAARPALLSSLGDTVHRYTSFGPERTVAELRPLLSMAGPRSLSPVFFQFGTVWIPALAGLAVLSWTVLRENISARLLLLLWSAQMLIATLLQNRMSVYLGIDLAIVAGWFCWLLVTSVRKQLQPGLLVIVALAVVAPTLWKAFDSVPSTASPGPEWDKALSWLREKTPEPMSNPAAFYAYYAPLKARESFSYPSSAYGVMNTWDKGHFISAVARRIPVSNGMQTGAVAAAQFFLSTDPSEAASILRNTRSRYVALDSSMPLGREHVLEAANGTFCSMAVWASKQINTFAETCGSFASGSLTPVNLFYPAYYQTMAIRLYTFDGKAVQPSLVTVFEYEPDTAPNGRRYKKIVGSNKFGTYDEAVAYISHRPGRRLLIASLDPLETCVPLTNIPGLRLAFDSDPRQFTVAPEPSDSVKIFEYSAR